MSQSTSRQARRRVEVTGAHGRPLVCDDAVEGGFGEVGTVQDAAPTLGRLVGGKDHEATAAVALADEMKENVGGVGSVGEVSDFVNDDELRADLGGQGVAEVALNARKPQIDDPHVLGYETRAKCLGMATSPPLPAAPATDTLRPKPARS